MPELCFSICSWCRKYHVEEATSAFLKKAKGHFECCKSIYRGMNGKLKPERCKLAHPVADFDAEEWERLP